MCHPGPMENDVWFIDPLGPLQIGQVYHSCAVCGDYLYTFGGDIGSDILNNSESYTGIIQKCELNNGSCTILDIAYNNVRYSRSTSVNDQVIILSGGQYNANEYTSNVDIFDCRNDEMLAGPDLPSQLTDFQMESLYDDSFVCIFGGQTIENGTYKISAQILCSPIFQDGIARYTFAASIPQQTTTTTQEAVDDNNNNTSSLPTTSIIADIINTPSPTNLLITTLHPTHYPSISTTLHDINSSIDENVDNIDNNINNGNNMLDEFENEANSNAAVIYGIIFGIIFCALCILIVVIYKSKRGASNRKSLARAQTVGADDDNFVVAKINEYESGDDELGVGHPQKKQGYGSHAIVECGIGDDESDESDDQHVAIGGILDHQT